MEKSVFKVEKKEKKGLSPVDEMKIAALKEIGRNPTILKYFSYLIEGYNKNIINASKPAVIDEKRTSLIEWHAKKEQLEGIFTAITELKRDDKK